MALPGRISSSGAASVILAVRCLCVRHTQWCIPVSSLRCTRTGFLRPDVRTSAARPLPKFPGSPTSTQHRNTADRPRRSSIRSIPSTENRCRYAGASETGLSLFDCRDSQLIHRGWRTSRSVPSRASRQPLKPQPPTGGGIDPLRSVAYVDGELIQVSITAARRPPMMQSVLESRGRVITEGPRFQLAITLTRSALEIRQGCCHRRAQVQIDPSSIAQVWR